MKPWERDWGQQPPAPQNPAGNGPAKPWDRDWAGGAPVAAPAPEQPDAIETALRKAQLPGRAVIEGVQDMAGMARLLNPAGLAQSLMNVARPQSEAARLTGTPDNPPDQRLADILGLVQPESAGERVFDAAGRGLTGAAMTGGASTLPALLGGATGGASGQITKEAGGGPVAQLIASLVGGLSPQAATSGLGAIRTAIANPQRAAGVIDDFATAGTTPNAIQATAAPSVDPTKPAGGAIAQTIDYLLRKTPGSAGRMADEAATQGQQIGARVDDVARGLTPDPTPEAAGGAIKQGFDRFVSGAKAEAAKLYDQVDKYLPKETPVALTRTQEVLAKEATEILPDSTMARVMSGITEKLDDAGNLPYAAVKELRSRIGKLMSDHQYVSDRPQLDRLYGALSDDVSVMAGKNPQGKAALDTASAFWRDSVMRPIEETQHVIAKAGGPEKIYNAAVSGTKDGATTLRSLMTSLKGSPEAQKAITGTVLARMGKAAPNAGEDAAAGFTVDRFVKDFDTLSPQARKVLFEPFGEKFVKDMDTIVKVARQVKAAGLRSKSEGGVSGALRKLSLGGAAWAVLGTAGAGAAAGTASGTANLTSRLLTNPKFVRWLASAADRPAGGLAAAAGALSANNPDDEDIAAFVAAARNESAAERPARPEPAPAPNPRATRPYEFGIMDNSPAGG